MRNELRSAFEVEIAELNEQLKTERGQLDQLDEDAPEQVVMIGRDRIGMLEDLVSAVEASRNAVLIAEGIATKRADNYSKWMNLVVDIRRGRVRLGQLRHEIKAAALQADIAEGARASAQARLADHLESRPEAHFTAPAKTRKWEADRAELETLLQEAVTARVAAVDAGAALRAELFALDEKLHARPQGMEFQAELLQPPPAPKFPGSQLGPGPRIQ
jgi:hypothetical protein